jgi:3-dehydroquinate dehydratase/shikimate dehydrogenase
MPYKGMPMHNHQLCIVITGPSQQKAKEQIAAAEKLADLLEFRLDLFETPSLQEIADLRSQTTLPVLFTVRKRSHGGQYIKREQERLEWIKALMSLKPEYVDVEYDCPALFFLDIAQASPTTRIICSAHFPDKTPDDLYGFLNMMRERHAHVYKIAIRAHSSLDALRMLLFVKQAHAMHVPLIGICLGEYGEITRILGPIFGTPITFSCLENAHASAPGQLSADLLLNTYRLNTLDENTQIFGLIGNPVQQSTGEIFHNRFFQEQRVNALYVKIPLTIEELPLALEQMKQLQFCGLSVTMPLKEEVAKHCVVKDTAINTLHLQGNRWIGANTDGVAALELIQQQESLVGKRVIMLGAGGAAAAIADELHRAGAQLTLLNRTERRAKILGSRYGAGVASLEAFSDMARAGYDLLIHCTPVGMGDPQASPIDCTHLLPGKLVIDLVAHPYETHLLREAARKGCRTINGMQLFQAQARRQLALWFPKISAGAP